MGENFTAAGAAVHSRQALGQWGSLFSCSSQRGAAPTATRLDGGTGGIQWGPYVQEAPILGPEGLTPPTDHCSWQGTPLRGRLPVLLASGLRASFH